MRKREELSTDKKKWYCVITARVRSTREGNISVCSPLVGGGGGGGVYPIPGPGGTHPRSRWRGGGLHPIPCPDGGYPNIQD